MSFSGQLIHRCTIQQQALAQNTIGELISSWSDRYTEVECRFIARNMIDASPESSQLVLATYKLLVESTRTAISVHDRVVDIVDIDGTSVDAGPFEVMAVMPRRGQVLRHTALVLEKRE